MVDRVIRCFITIIYINCAVRLGEGVRERKRGRGGGAVGGGGGGREGMYFRQTIASPYCSSTTGALRIAENVATSFCLNCALSVTSGPPQSRLNSVRTF